MSRSKLFRLLARGRPMRTTHHWVDPSTGAMYEEGDIIEIRFTPNGAYYNEPIVRVMCDGFAGGVMINPDNTEDMIIIPEMDSTGAVFVGPSSEAWSWQYRQAQWCKHLAIQIANVQQYD